MASSYVLEPRVHREGERRVREGLEGLDAEAVWEFLDQNWAVHLTATSPVPWPGSNIEKDKPLGNLGNLGMNLKSLLRHWDLQ